MWINSAIYQEHSEQTVLPEHDRPHCSALHMMCVRACVRQIKITASSRSCIVCTLGLVFLLVALYNNSWVLLQLLLVPLCDGKTPVLYETECSGLHYNPQDVARAGLWEVCHYFPFGYIPEFYYYTDPYCSNFSDDEIPAEWLETAQFLCQLAAALNIVGMSVCVLADLARSRDISWTGSTILVVSAACGFLGAATFYTNISKSFLIPYKLNTVSMYAHWGLLYFIEGCVMTLAAGLLQARVKI